ncbi:hypothetical protein U1Q18_007218 [Sarracenia purpurea var. burkii]
MAFSLSLVPAKPLTAPTTITQFPENPKTLILERCKTISDLNQIHAHLIKTRLLHKPGVAENLLESAAILLPASMDYAISIFNNLKQPNSPAYNIMIRGFTSKQLPNDAILLFKEMCERSVQSDEFTFPCILKACSRLQALKEGYTKGGGWEEVVRLFRKMREMDIGFHEVTLVCVLMACGRLTDQELGEWVNEYVEKNGLKGNPTLVTSLVDIDRMSMFNKICEDLASMIVDLVLSTEELLGFIRLFYPPLQYNST